MLLTLAVAAGLRILRDRAELRKVLLGCLVAGAAFVALFAILNPFALLNLHEARRQIKGQSGQAAAGKLGQDDVLGWVYYVGTLGWGLGWLPLAAAVGGAVVAIRRDWRLALLLLAFPVFLYLFMGSQGRYFGRWLLPAYPVLCILAGYGAVALATALKRPALLTARLRRAAVRPGAAGERPRRPGARAGGHACGGARLAARERARGRADRRRAVRARRLGGRVRQVAGGAPVPGLREAAAREGHRRVPRGRLLLRRRREHAEGARAEGRAALVGALLPARSTTRARRRSRSRPSPRAPTRSSSPTTSRSTTRRAPTSAPGRWSRSTASRTAIPAEPGSG